MGDKNRRGLSPSQAFWFQIRDVLSWGCRNRRNSLYAESVYVPSTDMTVVGAHPPLPPIVEDIRDRNSSPMWLMF